MHIQRTESGVLCSGVSMSFRIRVLGLSQLGIELSQRSSETEIDNEEPEGRYPLKTCYSANRSELVRSHAIRVCL